MGIAGFYLWLQRYYRDCVEDIPQEEMAKGFESTITRYDNLYLDMNGLIHPCCHDTAPLPEPESEEEMFTRIFAQLDKLVEVVRPRNCLVMAIDGVAPRSKMNQQRSRRFRAAEERRESDEVAEKCSATITQEYGLPKPEFKPRWDHNVITPSTAFMERVGQAIEWYILKKLNEDPLWKHLTVVFSDAHVPGEGEHKIMHYIRALRGQPGYNPNTSHCIYGMDADLICLGLSTHEPNFGILRNQLNEEFQPETNSFCYFNLCKFRQHLRRDFSNIRDMDFERVVDDFVFLCFFVGNDFLPHLPLVSIKTKGIELLLDHYVRKFEDHYYLTKRGEVRFDRLGTFIDAFYNLRFDDLAKEYQMKEGMKMRARKNMSDRVDVAQDNLQAALAGIAPDRSNAQAVSNKVLKYLSIIQKEQLRFVADREPLKFSYADKKARNTYYECKFGWDSKDQTSFEEQVAQCCREYLRGMQWVMRYYTKGCPSWEWFYPYHYAPLLQDLSKYNTNVNVEMRMSAPLHPVEQLLSVLPRESVAALPEELHDAVLDRNSALSRFYPDSFTVDISEALFSYQGIALLPFIKVHKLVKACSTIVELDPDYGTSLVYVRKDTALCRELSRLVSDAQTSAIDFAVLRLCPIAGRVSVYEHEYPIDSDIECPDHGLSEYCSNFGAPIENNAVRTFGYEITAHVDYNPSLLIGAKENLANVKSRPPPDRTQRRGGGGRPGGRIGEKRGRDDDDTNGNSNSGDGGDRDGGRANDRERDGQGRGDRNGHHHQRHHHQHHHHQQHQHHQQQQYNSYQRPLHQNHQTHHDQRQQDNGHRRGPRHEGPPQQQQQAATHDRRL